MRSTLPRQCRDAAKVLKEVGLFESGQGILLDAAHEIERLEKMAYNVPAQHEDRCNCIQCVPF